jgi:hypothetical protein
VHNSPRPMLWAVDQADDAGGTWKRFQDLLLHVPLAQKGLMVAKVKEMGKTSFATADNFTVGSRTLFFNQSKEKWPSCHKQAALLKQIEAFAEKMMIEAELKRSCPELHREISLIGEYAAEYRVREEIIYNAKRQDEVFLPLLVRDGDRWTRLYVYPWLSQSNGAFEFTGFKRFVVTVGMFAAGLRGECQNYNSFALIKYGIPFYDKQCVVNVFFEEDLTSNYEDYIFSQLQNLSAYIQTHTEIGQPKELFCHMPYFDYILFLIELFALGRIKLVALDEAIEKILEKRDRYTRQIEETCRERGVTAYISSPFDSIFEGLKSELQELPVENEDINNSHARAFLARLNVPCEEVCPETLSTETKTQNKRKLVQKCLSMLGNANPVWADFIKNDKKGTATLEDLFKMANAVVVAMSTRGTSDYQTLVWELLTEKQIQVSYADFGRIAKYPAVINFTVLDPSIIYTKTNGGNLFYQDRHGPAKSQKELMRRWPLLSQLAAQQDLSAGKVEEVLDLKADGQFKLT